jgi:hypothetical protein
LARAWGSNWPSKTCNYNLEVAENREWRRGKGLVFSRFGMGMHAMMLGEGCFAIGRLDGDVSKVILSIISRGSFGGGFVCPEKAGLL